MKLEGAFNALEDSQKKKPKVPVSTAKSDKSRVTVGIPRQIATPSGKVTHRKGRVAEVEKNPNWSPVRISKNKYKEGE
jgi:hypothetical protein